MVMQLPQFPFTEVKAVSRWSNYSGTISEQSIPLYCTIDVVSDAGDKAPKALARHGQAMRAILEHCFSSTPPLSLRVLGSAWSFSPQDTLSSIRPTWNASSASALNG
jgi:hypothetical protein